MSFRLVIADVVELPVKFTVNDGGKTASFAFHLLADRLSQDDFKSLAETQGDTTVNDFLAQHVTGWRGQRLVVNDAGEPAEFSPEAFACMLSLVGISGLVLSSYIEACGAKGKEKN